MDDAQGLPITFIVIAAVSIMILVLIVGFIMSGKSSMAESLTGPKAKQKCEDWCNDLNMEASNQDGWSGLGTSPGNTTFCNNTLIVEGQETTCSDMGQSCTVTWRDGSQEIVNCTDYTIN